MDMALSILSPSQAPQHPLTGRKTCNPGRKITRATATRKACETFASDEAAAKAFEQYGRQTYARKMADGSLKPDRPYARTVFGQWTSTATRFNTWIADNPVQCDGHAIDSARALADHALETWEQHIERYSWRSTDKCALRSYREFMVTGRVTMSTKVGQSKPRLQVHVDQQEEWAEFKCSLLQSQNDATSLLPLLSRGRKFFHFLANEWYPPYGMAQAGHGKHWGPKALREYDPRMLDDAFRMFARKYPNVHHSIPLIKKWLGIANTLQLPAHRHLLHLFKRMQETSSLKCNPWIPRRFLRLIEHGQAADVSGNILMDRDKKPYRSILDLARDEKIDQAIKGALHPSVKKKIFHGMSGVEKGLVQLCRLARDCTGSASSTAALWTKQDYGNLVIREEIATDDSVRHEEA